MEKELSKNNSITKEILQELCSYEDSLDALEGGYHDTHNLELIAENKDVYLLELKQYKNMLPEGTLFFSHCKLENGILIDKYK